MISKQEPLKIILSKNIDEKKQFFSDLLKKMSNKTFLKFFDTFIFLLLKNDKKL